MDEVKIIREFKGKSLIDIPDNYVAIDIETTGLDPNYDEIIEIGAIKVENNKEVETFNTLVKPNCEINDFIINLTGINNEMTKESLSINKVLPEFMNFIKDFIIVGHNVNFDINFIYDNLIKENMEPIANDFVDTLRLSKWLLPELKHHRLYDLVEYYNIDVNESHRALEDIRTTIKLINNLKETAKNKYTTVEKFKEFCINKKKSKHNARAKDFSTINVIFDEDNLLYDKYVTITGTLEKMTRKQAMQIITDLGGHCQDTVTKETNYLILGNNDYNPILKGKKSSKLLKAEQLKLKGQDIEILSENVFYSIISELSIE